MTHKHTPGPWEAFGPYRFCVYGGDPVRRIAVIDYTTGSDVATHDADLALIRAAPELLVALHTIVNLVNAGFTVPRIFADVAERAISKAAPPTPAAPDHPEQSVLWSKP